VTKEGSSGVGNRAAAPFVEDDGIDARFRNQLSDFQMSGYDRGHMVSVSTASPGTLTPGVTPLAPCEAFLQTVVRQPGITAPCTGCVFAVGGRIIP